MRAKAKRTFEDYLRRADELSCAGVRIVVPAKDVFCSDMMTAEPDSEGNMFDIFIADAGTAIKRMARALEAAGVMWESKYDPGHIEFAVPGTVSMMHGEQVYCFRPESTPRMKVLADGSFYIVVTSRDTPETYECDSIGRFYSAIDRFLSENEKIS